MDNTPTQRLPKSYDWFLDNEPIIPPLRREALNSEFVSLDEDPFESALRERRLREIRAGVRVPSFIGGDFDTFVDPSTEIQKAAAGLERITETASASGWGERAAQPTRERFREFTSGQYRDFAAAGDVESLQAGDMGDYVSSLLDALPGFGESTEQGNQILETLLKQEEQGFTAERKLQELQRILDKDPEIQEVASQYGIDLVSLALSSRNRMQLNFAIQQKIKEGVQQQRYSTYENANLGWFRRARWNAAEMVQDPYFVRDVLVTTAATAGLGTIELGAARLGTMGIQAGTRTAQVAHKALGLTGPMVGFVEGPTFMALRAAAPQLGVVGARSLAIATEGAVAGLATNLATQQTDYEIQELLFNDKYGKPFSVDYASAWESAALGSGLSLLALGSLRTILGAVGDIPAMYKVRAAGGTFNDMLRAYGREWTSSLDNWATSPAGLTVWGNTLSGGRGIYFGDMLDRMARRELDGRNFANVLAGGSRVWAAADPIMAARTNLNIEAAMPIIERFEKVTGIAGEAAMRGEAGGEAAAIFKALVDVDNYGKKNITPESVVRLLDELNDKLAKRELAPTAVGRLLPKELDTEDYRLMARAVGRSLNALSLSSQLESRGLNILKSESLVSDLRSRPIDIMNDSDWSDLLTASAYQHGVIDGAISATTLRQILDFNPADLSRYTLKADEAAGIKQSTLDQLAPTDEFTVVSGASAVLVNKKTGEISRLNTTLELDNDKLKLFVEKKDGTKVELKDLSGDDVVTGEKIALETNKLYERVRALFTDEAIKQMADDVRRAAGEEEDLDIEAKLISLKEAWDKGEHPSVPLLKKLFNVTTEQAVVGYAVARSLGFGPMEATLRFAKGVAGKNGFKPDSRAEIAFFTTEGANKALIRATKSTDLGSIIHEMGHFSFQTLFGRGNYNEAELRSIGISEALERKFLEWAGVDFSKGDIEEQIASTAVQEKLANGWNYYMRGVLVGRPTKINSAVHRLFNKLGDFIGDIGVALKSSESEELKLKMTDEAEEVFGLLLRRAEANIDDIYSAAYEGIFKTLTPELRDSIGTHILGEARYNDWKAKNELKEAAERSSIGILSRIAGVDIVTPESMSLVLDTAVGRSVSRRRIREFLRLVKKPVGVSIEDFKESMKKSTEALAKKLEDESTFTRNVINNGQCFTVKKAGSNMNLVDANASRLAGISTEALTEIVSTDVPSDQIIVRPTGIDDVSVKLVEDKPVIGLLVRGFEVTREMARVELDRRNKIIADKAEAIAAKELKKTEKARLKEEAKAKKEAERQAKKAVREAEAEAKKAAKEAKKEAEKAIRDEKKVTATKKKAEETAARLEDTRREAEASVTTAVETVRRKARESVEATATETARTEVELESVGERAVESADSIDTEIVTETDPTRTNLVTDEGIVITDASPTEVVVAVARNATEDSIESADARNTSILNAETPEEIQAAVEAPPAPAVETTVINVDRAPATPTVTRVVASAQVEQRRVQVVNAREQLSGGDATLVDTLLQTAFISAENLKRVVDSIDSNADSPELSKQYLAALMSFTAADALNESLKIKTLTPDEQIEFDKIVEILSDTRLSDKIQKAVEDLQTGRKTVDDVISVFPQSPTLRQRLELFVKGTRAQREQALFDNYKVSLAFINNKKNADAYVKAEKIDKAKRTEQQQAIVTQYEAHVKRVDLGPLVEVQDVDSVVTERARIKQQKEAAALSLVSEAEVRLETARRLLARKEFANLAGNINESMIVDLFVPFTDRTTIEYKIGLILTQARLSNKPLEPEMKLLGMLKADKLTARFEEAREALIGRFDGNVQRLDANIKLTQQIFAGSNPFKSEQALDLLMIAYGNMLRETEVDLNSPRLLLQHPTIARIGSRKQLDYISFSRYIVEKLSNTTVLEKLRSEDASTVGDTLFKSMTTEQYLEYIRAAARDGSELPHALVKYIGGIARNLERKDRIGSGPNRYEATAVRIDRDTAVGNRMDIEDTSTNEALGIQAFVEHQKILSSLIYDEMVRRGRQDLADFLTERQALAEEERNIAQPVGTAIDKINERRIALGKQPYSRSEFNNLKDSINAIAENIVAATSNPAFAVEVAKTKLLTARTNNELAANLKKSAEKYEISHVREDGETVATETADTVTVYQQQLDDISYEELDNVRKAIERISEAGDDTSELMRQLDAAGRAVEIVYDKLDDNIFKMIMDGRIATADVLIEELRKLKLNKYTTALLDDISELRPDTLRNIRVFPTADQSQFGSFTETNQVLLINPMVILNSAKNDIQGRKHLTPVKEKQIPFNMLVSVIVHELLHAVTTTKINRVFESYFEDPISVGEMAGRGVREETLALAEKIRNNPNATEMDRAVESLIRLWESEVNRLDDVSLLDTIDKAADNNLYHLINIHEYLAESLTIRVTDLVDKSAPGESNIRLSTKTMGVVEEISVAVLGNKALIPSMYLHRLASSTLKVISEPGEDILALPIVHEGTYRYNPDLAMIIPRSDLETEFESELFGGILDDFEARQNMKSARGRLNAVINEYQQKRAEFDLRSKIETEGMAGKDVADLEKRLEDLIVSADERQRILRGMGLHEELEPRDLEVLVNIVNGNSAFYTPDVKQLMEYVRKLEKATPRVDKPTAYRDMNNEERTMFLLESMLPVVEKAIGTRNETAGVFSLFSDSVVGKKANQFIGGAVDYSKTADSDSKLLQFLSKFLDPMMDLRDGELNLAFNMPSIDRLNAEVYGLYQKSGLAAAYEKVKSVAGDQASLDYINNTAWDYLSRKADLPETTRFRNEIIGVIDAINNINKEVHDLLVKYGGLRSSLTTAEDYGTVRRAGARAYRDPKGFADALYKHMLERSKAAHLKGEVSALAAEALGWLNYTRSDTSDEILTVSVPKESPLAKLFDKTDEDIEWSVAKKVLSKGVLELSKADADKLLRALESSADYKESYKKAHANRDVSYSVIRQSAEIARNRYMGFGDVGDTKTLKPRSESVGGGRRYSEERIITHSELAADRDLASFFDKNIMRLTDDMLRNQVMESMSTKMMTDFFGGNVRLTVLDVIEIFRNAGEGVRRGDVAPSVMEQTNKGYDRIKTVWEEFLGKSSTGTDSMDPYYRDALLNSRYSVLLAGGVRAALSSVPELTRAIISSDHNKSKLRQLFPNLLTAFKYGTSISRREKLNQMASAYHWVRNMSSETLLSRTEALPDNPFHSISFGGRRGWFSTWTNQWNAIRGVNEVETSKFRKLLNYLGFPASVAGAPLAWINMVTTAIHVHNAEMNLTKNAKNFKRLVELMDGRTITNMDEFSRLADMAGLTSKEALDLSTAGILNPKIVDILVDMAADPTTKTDEMLDVSKMYAWAREQTKYQVQDVDNAIVALGQYVGMTARHTNTEPTLLDKRVNNSVYSKALSIFMQFLLSHSIQEIGRRRRYTTVNYSQHIVGLMLMEAGVYAMGRMYRGEDPTEEDSTETFIRIATGMPMLGSYQYLAALLRQSAFAVYNEFNKKDKFEEQLRVPGLIDAPADTAPKRILNGVTWGGSILMDLLKEGS